MELKMNPVNKSIVLSNAHQANEIQISQHPNAELVALREQQLTEKEQVLLQLQRENGEATKQLIELKDLFSQTLAQQNDEKKILEQRIRGLESELKQTKLANATLIEEKARQNDALQDIIASLNKIVQDLKKRDWTAENTPPDVSGLTPWTASTYISIWEEEKKGYYGRVPTTPWMRDVLIAIENAKNAADQQNSVQSNPTIPHSNCIPIPQAKK